MSLDKWLNKEDLKRKDAKRSKREKKSINSAPELKDQSTENGSRIKKHQLKCQNKKCKFQKILVKKNLTEKDSTCPRCGGLMK